MVESWGNRQRLPVTPLIVTAGNSLRGVEKRPNRWGICPDLAAVMNPQGAGAIPGMPVRTTYNVFEREILAWAEASQLSDRARRMVRRRSLAVLAIFASPILGTEVSHPGSTPRAETTPASPTSRTLMATAGYYRNAATAMYDRLQSERAPMGTVTFRVI